MQEFQELYLKYNQTIYKLLLKLTNFNYDLADELTQETFFQVYLSLSRYKGDSSLLTWICAIARNVCYKYYKKNPITLDLEEAGIMHCETLEAVIERKELLRGIIKAVMELKQKYRDVLIYRLFFEMSFKQIAALLNISENSDSFYLR